MRDNGDFFCVIVCLKKYEVPCNDHRLSFPDGFVALWAVEAYDSYGLTAK